MRVPIQKIQKRHACADTEKACLLKTRARGNMLGKEAVGMAMHEMRDYRAMGETAEMGRKRDGIHRGIEPFHPRGMGSPPPSGHGMAW